MDNQRQLYRQRTMQHLEPARDAGRELVKRLTSQIRPVRAHVDEAIVNVQHDGDTAPALRKMKSIREPRGLVFTKSRRALERHIVAEKQVEEEDGSQERRLCRRLARLQLEMVTMAGDGNCQFRSMAHQVLGDAGRHMELRSLACEYIREKRDMFECFLGDDFETYINDMSRSGTWGDELTLRAMSDALGVVINVITSEKKHWYIQYWPTDEIKETSDVFVTYISPVHYNAINRKRTLARSVQEDERSDSGIATASTASGSDAPRSPCMPKQGRTLSWLSRRSMRQSS